MGPMSYASVQTTFHPLPACSVDRVRMVARFRQRVRDSRPEVRTVGPLSGHRPHVTRDGHTKRKTGTRQGLSGSDWTYVGC